jgi:hypothetical protein
MLVALAVELALPPAPLRPALAEVVVPPRPPVALAEALLMACPAVTLSVAVAPPPVPPFPAPFPAPPAPPLAVLRARNVLA